MKSNTRLHLIVYGCLLLLAIAYGAIMYGIMVVLDQPIELENKARSATLQKALK